MSILNASVAQYVDTIEAQLETIERLGNLNATYEKRLAELEVAYNDLYRAAVLVAESFATGQNLDTIGNNVLGLTNLLLECE
jgi:multidrug resistance efflux pump